MAGSCKEGAHCKSKHKISTGLENIAKNAKQPRYKSATPLHMADLNAFRALGHSRLVLKNLMHRLVSFPLKDDISPFVKATGNLHWDLSHNVRSLTPHKPEQVTV